MIKRVFLFFILSLSINLYAQEIQIPPEVFSELQSYTHDGKPLSVEYVQNFPKQLHDSILKKQELFFENLNGECNEYLNISFGPKIIGADEVEKSFEKGLIRIEAARCYDNALPETILNIVSSVAFKRRVFSTLRQASLESENYYCEITDAPTIGQSNYCYLDFEIEKNESSSSRVNFLTFNNKDPQFDAPVYFRESLQTARRVGAKTLFYSLSYARATSLSSAQRFFAKSYISSTQKNFFKQLDIALDNKK